MGYKNSIIMLINVEIPSGVTVKVEAEWFYSLSDEQLKDFYINNTINYEFNQVIFDPFNDSILDEYIPKPDDIEEIDMSIDFSPED
jgi:hypothetical protein